MVRQKCPDFKLTALMPDGTFSAFSHGDMQGRYTVLFFYPLDFTFVCPTEILAYAKMHDSFAKSGCSIIGASVDSEYAHLAWTRQPRTEGGLGGPLPFPLLSDKCGKLAGMLGAMPEHEQVALRATFIFDKKTICRHATINDLPIGRNIAEHLRLIKAIIHADEHAGQVCPADWTEGQPAISTKK